MVERIPANAVAFGVWGQQWWQLVLVFVRKVFVCPYSLHLTLLALFHFPGLWASLGNPVSFLVRREVQNRASWQSFQAAELEGNKRLLLCAVGCPVTTASRADVRAGEGHSPWPLCPQALSLKNSSEASTLLLSERLWFTPNLTGSVMCFFKVLIRPWHLTWIAMKQYC